MRSLPECRSFERGDKMQSSKLSVATWIFPTNLGKFDRLPCVRTYARIRTATFDIMFLNFLPVVGRFTIEQLSIELPAL